MTQTWPDTLKQFTFSDCPMPLQANAIYPLASYSIISAKGIDATKFLQGQISCDVENLTDLTATIGSHSTPKGRMISSFRLFKIDSETYYLLMKHNLVDKALTALKKYALFSKTTLSPEEDLVVIGTYGAEAANSLSSLTDVLPTQENQIAINVQATLVNLDETNQGYLAITNIESAMNLLSSAQASDLLTLDKQYDLLNHQKALGFIDSQTSELWVAQMLNYQCNGGISFTKGCYTGQEIIARMKYLGKLKRHMYHAVIDYDKTLDAGMELHLNPSSQSVGHIVSAVQVNENQWDVLWILTDDGLAADELYIGDNLMRVTQKIDLPYSLETD